MIKFNSKQVLFTVLLSIIAIFAYVNVSEATCIHTYAAATCTQAKTCTKCGATSGAPLGHNYVTSGNTAKCTRCGATKTVSNGGSTGSSSGGSNSHVHTYAAATCTQAKTCTSCGATSGTALGHSYNVTSQIAATCTTAGKTVSTCSRCGKTQTVTSEALRHSYSTTSNVSATCTTVGRVVKTCSRCGDTQTTTSPALGHSYSTTSNVSATCTSAGRIVKTCSRCGDTQTTSSPALGHKYVTTSTSATCTSGGKTVKKCSRCGDTQTTTTAALGHDYVTTSTSATCTSGGKTVRTCSRCGDTQTTTTAALGHDYQVTSNISATCTTGGKVIKTCTRCNDSIQTVVNSLGHDYKVTINIAATCTTSGKTVKTCSRCGDTQTTIVPSTEHKYVITTTTATCTTAGKTVKKCSVCGYTITTNGQALGHDFVETSKVDATCTENGKVVSTCSRCGEKEETTIPALGHEESIVFNTTHHWYECDRCNIETRDRELHDFNSNNICKVCGYHKGDEPVEPTDPDDKDNDGELIVEPWMKENDELNCLAVSLRSEPYEEDRANKNIYALDEKVIYYVDYKNGGKDTDKQVTLQLTLPLAFSVVDADDATVSKSKKTLTWTFKGMEEDEAGTKVVIIKYTSLGSSSSKYKQIIPKATISLASAEKDVSAVLNLIVKDFDVEINAEHDPYMYGDEDTKTFRPDATITRGEGALVLTRIFGISTRYDENMYAFPDLNETYLEARRAVIAATACGIIEGYPDGTYKPNKAMTRGEFITILARQIEDEYGEGFEVKDIDELIKVYKDKNRIYYISNTENYDAHWSVAYATLLARLNMTPLTDSETNLRLDEPITRAEVAQLVNFYLLRAPAKVTGSTMTQFPDVSRKHKLFADIVEATRESHTYSITEKGTEVAE